MIYQYNFSGWENQINLFYITALEKVRFSTKVGASVCVSVCLCVLLKSKQPEISMGWLVGVLHPILDPWELLKDPGTDMHINLQSGTQFFVSNEFIVREIYWWILGDLWRTWLPGVQIQPET